MRASPLCCGVLLVALCCLSGCPGKTVERAVSRVTNSIDGAVSVIDRQGDAIMFQGADFNQTLAELTLTIQSMPKDWAEQFESRTQSIISSLQSAAELTATTTAQAAGTQTRATIDFARLRVGADLRELSHAMRAKLRGEPVPPPIERIPFVCQSDVKLIHPSTTMSVTWNGWDLNHPELKVGLKNLEGRITEHPVLSIGTAYDRTANLSRVDNLNEFVEVVLLWKGEPLTSVGIARIPPLPLPTPPQPEARQVPAEPWGPFVPPRVGNGDRESDGEIRLDWKVDFRVEDGRRVIAAVSLQGREWDSGRNVADGDRSECRGSTTYAIYTAPSDLEIISVETPDIAGSFIDRDHQLDVQHHSGFRLEFIGDTDGDEVGTETSIRCPTRSTINVTVRRRGDR
jgi:hypothetical protein